jgi:hypothetical protein
MGIAKPPVRFQRANYVVTDLEHSFLFHENAIVLDVADIDGVVAGAEPTT